MTDTATPLRIAHLSDLHFGAQHPGAADVLLEAVHALAPTLTLITGDLTQRARNSQFVAARAFFDALPGDWLAIPGNHDMPLFRPWHRLFTPRGRYRRHIGDPTASRLDWPDLRLTLLDSTDRLAWRAGRLRPEAADRAAHWLARAAPGQLRMAAAHHPFASRQRGNKGGMSGARHARRVLIDEGGVDVLLWGHLHRTETLLLEGAGARHAIGIGVGSPTSSRHPADGFFFHQIDITRDTVQLTVLRRLGHEPHFHPFAHHRYVRDSAGWRAM